MATRSSTGEVEVDKRNQPVVRLVNTLQFPKRTAVGKPNHPKG